MNNEDTGLLRLIAVFKLLKVATLIASGFIALGLTHADVGTVLERWVLKMGLDPGSSLLNHAIQRICEIPQDQVWELGAVSFIYAALFATEGIGLWFAKRWAEWFTVIITGSLIPFEAYEMFRRPTSLRVIVFAVNIAVVAYLIYRIIHEPRRGDRRSASSNASASEVNAASDSAQECISGSLRQRRGL
ncbi:MAG: DUF2127 domain-containing protein [Acidobacteria bacterium]|nr:DUF2127 domain-containing protein [Acidobacteriota bacterium]